ncbi:spinster family MFS transporter [Steroidobacter cummioxidans]|uniref:spinster family MFS transporter n=1 Tax=Steroidobacter cummioxidans TaxID=1803913 RepID=UPI000E31C35B|nr:MFS transporter [Steroidobacter cummioxidans]
MPQGPAPGTGYKRYVLAMMTSVYMLNLVDRGLMSLLLQPIKEDLSLSDTQLGFLTGIAFALFYATLGLPIARWADRGNRVTVTSLAIGLWGLTVMACVLVTNFVQLVFARVAAAVGEAGCKPPTYSLVGDYFSGSSERTRAMAIYLTGNSLSTLVAYTVGGWLNELYGWRMTFFIMGILGLLLAIAVKLTVIEPRTQTPVVRTGETQAPSTKVVIATLWRQPSFRHLSLALILLYTVGLGLGPWQAAFMIRTYHMSTGELGLWLGLICSASGVVGALLGGYLASRYFQGNERGQMAMSALAVALILPCFVAFLMLPEKNQALLALIPLMMVFTVFMGPTYALMQRLVADNMRATMMALVMLLANLVGMGLGPQIVGILSDLLRPTFGGDALRYAMLIVASAALWSAYHFLRVGRTVANDLAAMGHGASREPVAHGGRRGSMIATPAASK